jgi:hypothetical protein
MLLFGCSNCNACASQCAILNQRAPPLGSLPALLCLPFANIIRNALHMTITAYSGKETRQRAGLVSVGMAVLAVHARLLPRLMTYISLSLSLFVLLFDLVASRARHQPVCPVVTGITNQCKYS